MPSSGISRRNSLSCFSSCLFHELTWFGAQSVSFPESLTFSHLSELGDFFSRLTALTLCLEDLSNALFLSRRNSYALLSSSSSYLSHELTFCTQGVCILALLSHGLAFW